MRTFFVDSFTDTPFSGNPAGVCLSDSLPSDRLMLNIARELGLSETAFVAMHASGVDYDIRYFSPKMEIPLCGHATLGAARVLFDCNDTAQVQFTNVQGLILRANRMGDRISMEFPLYQTQPAKAPAALLTALGLASVENVAFNEETNILLLQIDDVDALARLQPDFEALLQSHDGINGVLVTAPSGADGFDFHSRYFWPWSGTNEDPVTGGTHTFLTGYWARRLGKKKMRSFQSSERGGFLDVEILGESVLISGQAVVVLEGALTAKAVLDHPPEP